MHASRLPPSAVPQYVGLAGLAGFAIALAIIFQIAITPLLAVLITVALAGAPMWWLEWRRHRGIAYAQDERAASNKLPRKTRQEWRLRGLCTLALPWIFTLCTFQWLARWTIPGFWGALSLLWPALALSLLVYVLKPPPSAPMGAELVGRWWTHRQEGRFPWAALRDQLVKAYFLPLMVGSAFTLFQQAPLVFAQGRGLLWYLAPLALLYLVDVVFGVIGYASTSRRLGAEIRSSNPFMLAWASAMVCYPPLVNWLAELRFQYNDGYEWFHWLGASGWRAWAWGTSILVLVAIYAWATVIFGIRFSNLTNRGIITNGPFRFTKHPAFISKNLSWWLVSVPFLSLSGTTQAAIHCIVLLAVNGIYYVRAKTEERHLMQDATYRAYAEWIAVHGLFARLRLRRRTDARP